MQSPETAAEAANLAALYAELDWLEAVIAHAFASYSNPENPGSWLDLPPPSHEPGASLYGRQIAAWSLSPFERLALALAMAPHLRPQALDGFLLSNAATNHPFSEFGGRRDERFNGFLPTGQTLAFLIAANDPSRRDVAWRIVSPQHHFAFEGVLQPFAAEPGLPNLAKGLLLSETWLQRFITGEEAGGRDAGLSPLTTPLEWSDLVLDDDVVSQILEIQAWL